MTSQIVAGVVRGGSALNYGDGAGDAHSVANR